MSKLSAVIMAAGKSKRMKTKLPKVLHPLMGKSLIDYVLDAAEEAGVEQAIVVVGHEKEKVMEYVGDRALYACQDIQLGTGHAVMQALPQLEGFEGDVLVLSGDMPLLTGETIRRLAAQHHRNKATLSVLTAVLEDPGKLGRIVRDKEGKLKAIVEAVDADQSQLEIKEINTGTYIFDAGFLRQALPRIKSENAQQEIYLTDTIAMAIEENKIVHTVTCKDPGESLGVNSRQDLALASEEIRKKINGKLMAEGVTIYDPSHTYIEASAEINNDTVILPGCMITGKTKIGSDCVIGPNSRIHDSSLGDGVTVRESVILESDVENGVNIGPYAHIRPGTRLRRNSKIGNFVETKKSTIGEGSKVPHLSYVGDATVGSRVNIGAGTITCNYDGKNKNPTHIGDFAFIGTNSSLVAPVRIGEGAATGAGSVVTRDIPDYKLAVGHPARAIKTLKKRDET